MKAKTIKVLLQGISGNPKELHIDPLDTVGSLVPVIHNNIEDTESQIYFFHKGQQLNHNITFSAQDVCEDSKIVYLIRKTLKNKRSNNISDNEFISILPFENFRGKFLIDMFQCYLRSNDLYYTTIDANKDANYYYQRILSQEEKDDDLILNNTESNNMKNVLLNTDPGTAVSNEPLPILWEIPTKKHQKSVGTST